VFAQTGKNQAIERTNTKTDTYVDVPGMQLSMIPPRDFEYSDRFNGFEHKLAGSSIMISEVPGDVHQNFLAFGKASLIKTGIILENEALYQINGYDALFQQGEQGAYGKVYTKFLLVIGDYTKTFLISASLPIETSVTHKKEVREAMLTVIYDPDRSVSKEDMYDFTVDFSESGLIQGKILVSSLIYTDDGNVPPETDAKTALMVNRSKAVAPIKDTKAYTIKLLKMYPVSWAPGEKLEPKAVTVGGLNGYEIYGIGINSETNKAELIYQMVLFKGDYYYTIAGMTYQKFEENLTMFQKTANTFTIKND
jgi:hypothetical protein